MKPRPVYRLLRRLFRYATELYYVDIQVAGEEHMPTEGPVVLASNHPNSIMDTVVLGAGIERSIHYLARSGLFSNPIVATLFEAAGAIPVYRREDAGSETASNDEVFRAAYAVLARHGVIGIFPEGKNAPERHIRDIKTGAARIALGAEAQNNFLLGVKVVPVGLNFENRSRFLSRVLVRFGEPLQTQDYRSRFEVDEQVAVRALTDDLQDAMREQAVHIDNLRHEELLADIYAIYGRELLDETLGRAPDLRSIREKLVDRLSGRSHEFEALEDVFQTKQWIADAIDHFGERDPSTVSKLRHRITRYKEKLDHLGLKLDVQHKDPEHLSVRKETLRMVLYGVLTGPVAAWGFLHNYLPAALAVVMGRRARQEAARALHTLLWGMLFFGVAYSVYAFASWKGTGSVRATAFYLCIAALSGFWALRFRRTITRRARNVSARALFLTNRRAVDRLANERKRVLEDLRDLRGQYELALESGQTRG